jgi:hypothetical protein
VIFFSKWKQNYTPFSHSYRCSGASHTHPLSRTLTSSISRFNLSRPRSWIPSQSRQSLTRTRPLSLSHSFSRTPHLSHTRSNSNPNLQIEQIEASLISVKQIEASLWSFLSLQLKTQIGTHLFSNLFMFS